ncbi:MAG: 2-dehydropantoate 2-reductase N-terminal domain-containing protein, partial [Candidatus Deferrimicrobiaceae bacterium]
MTTEHAGRIAVIGGGSWGTAFAAMLAERHKDVSLWIREKEVCATIRSDRENRAFLPGVKVPEGVCATTCLEEALAGRTIVAFAVPSQHMRELAGLCGPHFVPGAVVVSLAKGLENGTLLRMTEVLAQALPGSRTRLAVLSGPTFAGEVARGSPSGATVASEDPMVASSLQTVFSGKRFRVYAGTDVTGIEIGGALKNVMAIAAGM